MTVELNAQRLEKALEALAERLAFREASASFVVCGGAGLAVLGLVPRSTEDIDVLAAVDRPYSGGPIVRTVRELREVAEALPTAVGEVSRDLEIAPHWINTGPAKFIEAWGLPPGFEKRLEVRDYGPSLRVWFIGREDQIAFKIIAAMSRGELRDLEDLMDLAPMEEEVRRVVEWLTDRRLATDFMPKLMEVLEGIGYGNFKI